MSETLAYLAGIVDGEGYIGIKRTKWTPQKEKQNGIKSDRFTERIQIRMTDESAIRLFRDTLGGNYHKELPKEHSKLSLYCYSASDKRACEVLQKLLPFMLVKKRDAELVLKLRELKNKPHSYGNGKGKMTKEDIKERYDLWLALKKLHGGGD